MIKVRVAKAEDASRLLEIYAYYVEHTAISFEYEVPSLAEFTERIRNTLVTYPYLVAEEDDRIVGYIYASRFAQRAAYDWAAGTSVYIDRDCRRKGIGKLLYEKFEAILKLQNITNLYAGAADPMEDDDPYLTRSSEHFHEAIGYRTVARHHACGSKFGRWYNLLWMEKIINEHGMPPKEVVPFSELGASAVQAILQD